MAGVEVVSRFFQEKYYPLIEARNKSQEIEYGSNNEKRGWRFFLKNPQGLTLTPSSGMARASPTIFATFFYFSF